jgi:hypothetical protein
MRFARDSGFAVTSDVESARARRYLLGQASEDECSRIEREYFRDESVVDRIDAAEENLIEDYLAERLGPDERGQFTRHYLASPTHRRRVEAVRRLTALGGTTAVPPALEPARSPSPWKPALWQSSWPAAAAAVLVLAAAATYTLTREQRVSNNPAASNVPSSGVVAQNPRASSPAAPRVFTLSISPAAVRSAGDSAAAIIPSGTDIVVMQLEGDGGARPASRARAVVRTVSGSEVWRGPASVAGDLPAGVRARIEVPAARVPADDYIVELFGPDAKGVERQQSSYFLRLRAR